MNSAAWHGDFVLSRFHKRTVRKAEQRHVFGLQTDPSSVPNAGEEPAEGCACLDYPVGDLFVIGG